MKAENSFALFTPWVCNKTPRFRTLLPSYTEVVNYFRGKLATDQAIPEYDASILKYLQLLSVTPRQYADNIFSNSSRVADVNEKSMLNDAFVEMSTHRFDKVDVVSGSAPTT